MKKVLKSKYIAKPFKALHCLFHIILSKIEVENRLANNGIHVDGSNSKKMGMKGSGLIFDLMGSCRKLVRWNCMVGTLI